MPTRVVKDEGEMGFGFGERDEKCLTRKKVAFKEEKGFVKSVDDDDDDDESSSIGKNSDVSQKSGGGDGEEEVESSYSIAMEMDALQQVLPIRRGISGLYNGKSKSFASLADASSLPSIKDIAKPDNAYTRKRRNLLACNLTWDKNRRRSARTTLALALAITNSNEQAHRHRCASVAAPACTTDSNLN